MDLTEGNYNIKDARAKKMMLWFGIVSLSMMFAGLTSAYVVSKSRPDWLKDFDLPIAFLWSTIAIICSSITMHLAKKTIRQNKRDKGMQFLMLTLFLGIIFIALQFFGFSQIISEQGYYFTGDQSSITTSFLYIITVVHIIHVIAGIVVLFVVIYNHFKKKYDAGKTLGLELGVSFWHFLDVLWLYLILFFYFFR